MSAYDKLLAQEELYNMTLFNNSIEMMTNLSLFLVDRFPQGIHICNFASAFPVAHSAGHVYIQLLLGTKFPPLYWHHLAFLDKDSTGGVTSSLLCRSTCGIFFCLPSTPRLRHQEQCINGRVRCLPSPGAPLQVFHQTVRGYTLSHGRPLTFCRGCRHCL